MLMALCSFLSGQMTRSWSSPDSSNLILAEVLDEQMRKQGSSRKQDSNNLMMMHDAPYFINDRTMRLSRHVDRLWLRNGHYLPSSEETPKTKLVLTDFGWNQKNVTAGLEYPRTILMREVTQAVIDYGGRMVTKSSRHYTNKIQSALKALHSNTSSRLHYFYCRGVDTSTVRKYLKNPQLSLATIYTEPESLFPKYDYGLLPPAVNPVRLGHQERDDIATNNCKQESTRNYLLSCVGSVRGSVIRKQLFTLNAPGIVLMLPDAFAAKYKNTTYQQLMKESVFAATPRGDNLFSYRFTEVLSAGAIPVIHSDGWVLPYRKEMIAWENDCAIVIPERMVNQTMDA